MSQKIQEIKVIKLFGEYDHQISLTDGVHVIMGENGIGKTSILKLVNALFSGDILTLTEIKFESFEILFTSSDSIVVVRNELEEDITITVSINKAHEGKTSSCMWSQNELLKEQRFIEESERPEYTTRYSSTISRIERQRRQRWQALLSSNESTAFLVQVGEYCQTEFIPAQRLQTPVKGTEIVATVTKIARDLKKYILSVFADAAQKSNELDQSFPERLIENLKNDPVRNLKTQVGQLLNDVIDELNLLNTAGILDDSQILKRSMLRNINSSQQPQALVVLNLYLKDYLEKLKAHHKLAQKLDLYFQTLNTHFLHKVVGLDKNRDLVIRSKYTGERIPISRLSSGEQNELILFYYLIFECDDKQLALIDEPEISLHIKWLDKLLPIFKQIAATNGMQMLIATHSPDFVGSNTDILQLLSD